MTGADVAQAVGVPVIAAVAADRGLDARLERGRRQVRVAAHPGGRAGDGLLAEVSRDRAPDALVERVRRRLALEGWSATPASVTDALRAEGLVLAESSIVEVVRALRTGARRLGVLEAVVGSEG